MRNWGYIKAEEVDEFLNGFLIDLPDPIEQPLHFDSPSVSQPRFKNEMEANEKTYHPSEHIKPASSSTGMMADIWLDANIGSIFDIHRGAFRGHCIRFIKKVQKERQIRKLKN